jgi:predicted GIY-YIG superfamily endonuclease
MTVYLLHFERPISDSHTTQHYLGFAKSVDNRISQHRAGDGARLCQVAKQRGISFSVARVWQDGDRALERRLKNRKNSPRICPICNQHKGTTTGPKTSLELEF